MKLAAFVSMTLAFTLDPSRAADATYSNLTVDTTLTVGGTITTSGNERVFFGGTIGSGQPITGPGYGMMWYPKKGAFRFGLASLDQWNDTNTGSYSIAGGYDSKASGPYAVALGYKALASAYGSVAMGYSTSATGMGCSTALGIGTASSGYCALATGASTVAIGAYSSTFGYSTQATGTGSTSSGTYTIASGNYATATGSWTVAQAPNSFVVGEYNLGSGGQYTSAPTDALFIVGNGTSMIRKNAFAVYRDGTIKMQKAQGDILMGEFGAP